MLINGSFSAIFIIAIGVSKINMMRRQWQQQFSLNRNISNKQFIRWNVNEKRVRMKIEW